MIQKIITVQGLKTTPNKELIKEHNRAAEELKKFVYTKQAEVYNYWLHQPELTRAVFVIETSIDGGTMKTVEYAQKQKKIIF